MNKRSMPRWRRRLKVMLAGTLAFTSDISPSGIAVELGRWLIPGSTVHGCLAMNGKELPFTAQVAWAERGDVRLDERPSAGVRLTGIDPAYFELLSSVASDE